jgi:hypothetical protein
MTATVATTATTPTNRKTATATNARSTALTAGILYLITFVASIPALVLYKPFTDHADFVVGAGSSSGVMWGALLEVVMAFACIGTAVVLYPVARRQSETAALGFVTARVLEASLIFVGVISVLAAVTLRPDLSAGDSASAITAGHTLIAVHKWAFLLGPGLIPGINALCLGYVMYRSRLVPRSIPTIGLLGAPLLFAAAAGAILGHVDQVSAVGALAALPIAAWEFSLGMWLVVKGFRPSAVAALGLAEQR